MLETLTSYEPVHGLAETYFAEVAKSSPTLSRPEIYQKVAARVLVDMFKPFHANAAKAGTPDDKRWDIYAEGGYLLGVESNIPHKQTQQAAIEALGLKSDSRLLVCGSGTGPLEQTLIDQGEGFTSITALERSGAMVGVHAARFSERADVVVKQVDLNSSLLEQGVEVGHDRVAIINTLEFLDQRAFLSNLQEVLEAGANGVIVIPKADMKNYLPSMREHLKASGIDFGEAFWEEIDLQLTEIYGFIFTETPNGMKVLNPEKLDDERVSVYLQKYAKVLGAIAETVSTNANVKVMTDDAKAVFTAGLANAIPPAIVGFPSDEALHNLITTAGFSVQPIKEWESVNANLSRLIKFNKD